MSRRRSMLAAALAAAALTWCVSGCSGGDDDADGDGATPGPTDSASSSVEPTPSDTSTSTTSEPSTQPTEPAPTDSDAARARRAQIPAAKLPGFNSEWVWVRQSGGPGPGQDVPSVCQRASLTAIGAVNEYRTNFASPADTNDYAVQMTGVFPDEQTVATAMKVLDSWHDKCRRHATNDLGLRSVNVGELTPVATAVGEGTQWLTTYGPTPSGSPDERWFEATGYVADGDTLTMLVMANVGQDYNYPAGEQPMDLAVQEAGRRLEASR